MSKGTEILNLSYLLDQEKEAILAVLKRDDNLKKIEDKRVRKLKNELLEIKKKGAKIHKLRQNRAKICVRCQKSLGLIFNRGDICRACQLRVCKSCRVVIKENVWKCTVCAKISEIRIATGDWFFEERAKRFKNSTVLGSDVVRKSIMRKTTGPIKTEETQMPSNYRKENVLLPEISENAEGGGKRLDKRIGKQARRGDDAISVHSNFDTQSLRSISSIPRSERTLRSDIYGFTECSQAGQDCGEVISQASLKIDCRPESKHSSPASVRGSVHSLDTSTLRAKSTDSIDSAQSGIRSNGSKTNTTVASSPTPSKHSMSSNYSHTHAVGSGIKASSSIPEAIGNGHRRRSSGTPSIALSRVSIASDRSRSELDLSGNFAEGNEETRSITSKSKSVPGGLNTDLEYFDEIEEDFPDMLAHKGTSIKSGYSMTSLNSMTSIYSETGDYGNIKVTGEIILNINYSYKTGALNVLVKSCKNLAVADERKNRTDPYVKAYLLPDKSRQSKRKTKIKTNTTNPEFNESLKYVISHTQLETRTLHLSVWHNDRFGRNSFLGEVNIPLDTWNFENQEDESFTLQSKMDMSCDVTLQYKGEITIGLRYIPPEKNLTLPLEPISTGKKSFRKSKKVPMPTGGILEVLLKEAKNLTAVKSGGTSDTFVKGYLLPDNNKSTKHKTPIVKKSVNPQWNFLFSFTSLQPNDLQNVCLELTVWDKESLSSNVFLGGVCLSCGSGTSYGNEVDWMDAHGEEQYLWQKMLDSPGTLVEGTLMLRSTMAKHKNATQKS